MTPAPSTKPRQSAAEIKAQKAVPLEAIRLQIAIHRELDARGITTAAAISAELELPAEEATTLLRRKQLREGDLVRLEVAAAHIGLPRG